MYVDKYIAVKRDDSTNFVETIFDEASQLETIVPGQFSLADDEITCINSINKQRVIIDEARILVRENTAFVFEKANIAKRIIEGYCYR